MMMGQEDARGWPATQSLREDYAALEPVLSGITRLAGQVRDGHPVHPLLLAGALTCLDVFQRCHDQKIEGELLPALLRRQDAVGPEAATGVTREHREMRERVAGVRRLLEGSGHFSDVIGRVADECVAHVRAHAVREAEEVFGLADRVLPAGDAGLLREAFHLIDVREILPGEREALRALAAAIGPGREAAENVTVGGIVAAHLMRPRPRSARPADTLARAVEIMDRSGVRELPVVEDGRLCGIISRTDMQAHLGHLEWTSVEAAMTPQPVVVSPEQSAAAVSRVLLQGHFNAVPVITAETTLIGMISRSDVLRAVAE